MWWTASTCRRVCHCMHFCRTSLFPAAQLVYAELNCWPTLSMNELIVTLCSCMHWSENFNAWAVADDLLMTLGYHPLTVAATFHFRQITPTLTTVSQTRAHIPSSLDHAWTRLDLIAALWCRRLLTVVVSCEKFVLMSRYCHRHVHQASCVCCSYAQH